MRPRAYPRVDDLIGASLGEALAIVSRISLGWIGLIDTNTLAYYKNS